MTNVFPHDEHKQECKVSSETRIQVLVKRESNTLWLEPCASPLTSSHQCQTAITFSKKAVIFSLFTHARSLNLPGAIFLTRPDTPPRRASHTSRTITLTATERIRSRLTHKETQTVRHRCFRTSQVTGRMMDDLRKERTPGHHSQTLLVKLFTSCPSSPLHPPPSPHPRPPYLQRQKKTLALRPRVFSYR